MRRTFSSYCASGRVEARTSRGRSMPLYVSSIEADSREGGCGRMFGLLWEESLRGGTLT